MHRRLNASRFDFRCGDSILAVAFVLSATTVVAIDDVPNRELIIASVHEHCEQGRLLMVQRDPQGSMEAYQLAIDELLTSEPNSEMTELENTTYFSVLADASIELARLFSLLKNSDGILASAKRARSLYASGKAHPAGFNQHICGSAEYPNGRLVFSSVIVSYYYQVEKRPTSELLADAEAIYDMAKQKRGDSDPMVKQMHSYVQHLRRRLEMDFHHPRAKPTPPPTPETLTTTQIMYP
eukprot:TRINITY_DN56258_c0_g1_i1.p1 TRINITY_DN56258_c0_g1~~TRINITY_DN56258_c0_g1_i1.p1  ORF type:complete len:261 (+),score=34.20 TRINITY_DN56258_c0_g1_i1:67-783(+)